ncbi:MAG TPA: ABC transporter ATP-binding protein, partial [Planctomycetaceae bacterium]|nr:ABC transporter ATP-binding protein [Planctomycetaceae bacterium]
MRLLIGDVEPDHGDVVLAQGTKTALLPQDVPRDLVGTIHDVVAAGLPDEGIHRQWRNEQRVEQTLARMQLNPGDRFETLSSGMKRRVLLARALAAGP